MSEKHRNKKKKHVYLLTIEKNKRQHHETISLIQR